MNSKPNSKKPCIENNPNPEICKVIPMPSQVKENNKPQVCNPFTDIKQANNKMDCKNQTQLFPNSIDKHPFHANKNSEEVKNGILKIKLFKSTIKPFRSMNPEQNDQSTNLELLKKKTTNKNEEMNKSPLILEQAIDKKAQYKMLIKKIALQLKKKIRPRTKGYFYENVFRNEKYKTLVKKIAYSIKNKIGSHPPTNGAFYSYMKKEEEIKMKREEEIKMKKDRQEKYKTLIKKISSQLKKRVKFPTCKIIKIYESYRKLIKRIADALKNSLKNSDKNNSLKTDVTDVNIIKENDEENKDKMTMDIEEPICDKKENEEINLNKIKEDTKEEDNKMDIEMADKIDNTSTPFDFKGIQTEIKKESGENNELKTFTYKQKPCWISSKKKSEDNNISNYTFSKMEVIDNNIPNSSEQKRPPIIIEDSEKNKANINNEIKEMPDIVINTDEFIPENKKEEINNEDKKEEIIEEKQENIISKHKSTEIQNSKVNKDIIKSGRSLPVPNSSKNKSLFFCNSIFKKDTLFSLNPERKLANKSHAKINMKLNLENLNEIYNNLTGIEKNENKEKDICLQDIETTKSNFINQFEKFLEQENIEIINNLPVSTNEKNIILFQQSNFWYLIMTYLFYKKKDLSIYNILSLLEQYNAWAQDKTKERFDSLKERTKEYINSHNSKESLDQFLFMNKLDNLDKIFEKFELDDIDKNKNFNDYLEIKLEDVCFLCDSKEPNCKCDLCINDEACIQKVRELNKNKIEIVNNSSIDIKKKEITKEDIIKRNNDKVVLHNNEELFYKGNSKKNKSGIFSKSKTIFEDGGNLEYIYIPKANNSLLVDKEEPEVKDKNEELIENIESDINNREKENKEMVIEDRNANANEEMENKNDSSFENSNGKTFKNISKSEKKFKEVNKEEERAKSEGKEVKELIEEKEEEKEEDIVIQDKEEEVKEVIQDKEEKEEKETVEEESKILKKDKKSRKGKSRKKNNKKKDSMTKNTAKDEEKEEKKEEEKEGKKKRKSTNRASLKKNKSKNCAKNEETEEKIEINESEEIDVGTRSAHKLEVDSTINNSKRKKSKTPNKKKSRKH